MSKKSKKPQRKKPRQKKPQRKKVSKVARRPSPAAKGRVSKGRKRGPTSSLPKRRAPAPKPRQLAPQVRAQVYDAIKTLRKHIYGYEARDGYGVKDIDHFSTSERHRLIQRAASLTEMTNAPHDLIKATSKKARKNLQVFTKQSIRNAKHFIVHKPTDSAKVRIRDGYVDISGQFGKRVFSRSQFFLFPRRPRYPKELVAMARKLLKDMPQGFYSVITAAHGDTGEPFERDELINRLNTYLADYIVDEYNQPTGFAEALVGFRFMSTTLDGAEVQMRARDARRARQKKHNEQERKKLIQKMTRKKRRKPRKGK